MELLKEVDRNFCGNSGPKEGHKDPQDKVRVNDQGEVEGMKDYYFRGPESGTWRREKMLELVKGLLQYSEY